MKILLFGILSCLTIASAHAGLIANGGFESGLAGWTSADLLGSDGTFFVQSGTSSPVNGLPVPPPPEGTNAAMTDAQAGGSHVLYQDFVVPNVVTGGFVVFSLFVNSGAEFETRDHLEWSLPDLNQQARVDILTPTSDPFSIAAADVLQNLYRTETGDPLISGYTPFIVDVTSLLQAHQGETLRLRFAEVDNVNIFNLGVDSVDIVDQVIPEPASWTLAASALVALWAARRLRS